MNAPMRLGGITLEQYAGVSAALADAIPVADVLAQEHIPASGWPAAERAWREAIAQAPDLQMRFIELKRKAEDALSRTIEPIDSDPKAWAGLLGAMAVASDSGKLLATLGLRAPDIARIGRAWNQRAAGDPQVSKALAAAAGKSAAPASLRADPMRLKPFPWTPKPAAKGSIRPPSIDASQVTSSGPAALRARQDGSLPVSFDVDLFAALSVALELAPERRAAALGMCGLDETSYAHVEATWSERMKRDPDLRANFSIQASDHRSAFRRLLAGARWVMSDA